MKSRLRSLLAWSTLALLSASCGKSDEGEGPGGAGSGSGGSGVIQPGETGSVCEVAADCFPDVAAAGASGALQGEAMCLDRVRGGYCTHTCEADTDCCAASGECTGDHAQVCSPFESTDAKMCFLTCEEADIAAVGAGGVGAGGASGNVSSDQEYCQRFAGSSFICRSSGGGKQNRKVCVPGDCGVGAGCAADTDCSSGLSCFTGVKGGYCGQADCETNADCGGNGSCVHAADGKNYCYKTCQTASDCSFCRSPGFYASCSDNVVFAEDGTTGSVCVPPS